MTAESSPLRSMRQRLFVSHAVVIVIALAVLAVVLGLVALVGGSKAIDPGRRLDGRAALLLAVTAGGSAAGLVSWRVAKRLAEPLEQISAATRALAAGHYGVRAQGGDTIELNALAGDVNRLASELETTEERRLRLIGDVAHELRNPLSTIQGTMEALLDGVVAADDATYARIGREAARLRRLADDLSSLSSAGELGSNDRGAVDLAALLVDVVAHLRPQSAAKDLTLTVDSDPLPSIQGDADRLTQVLTNVVGNAIQYTDAGHIGVRAGSANGVVTISVTDTGRGLAPEDQTRIFERFHRVDQHFADGTGVGLAIAKLIVEAHGGTIGAQSDGLGTGTTITIGLPVTGPVQRDREATPSSG